MTNSTRTADGVLNALVRWQDSGALWRVTRREPTQVTVGLFRCDGGEEVGRIISGEATWLEYLSDRDCSEGWA